eukprot:5880803-Pyramimonas_sp.AAC.1
MSAHYVCPFPPLQAGLTGPPFGGWVRGGAGPRPHAPQARGGSADLAAECAVVVCLARSGGWSSAWSLARRLS